MNELYIGVMSGTSLDAIDIALCEIDSKNCKLIASHEHPFDKELKKDILRVIDGATTLKEVGTLNSKLGYLFADAINYLIEKKSVDKKTITAIGLHGQTLWHEPNFKFPFSMQLGCPNIVSAKTGIKVVSDFRSMDIANGGQGAPFAPIFHKEVFKYLGDGVVVVNIGGMSNITILDNKLRGWDCGCGNVLMDLWILKYKNIPYDKNGDEAKSGKIHTKLLDALLCDSYFKQPPPKSTGREYFNESWLQNHLDMFQTIKNEDILRTLLELTAKIIIKDVKIDATKLLLICGGGAKNKFLMQRLHELSGLRIGTTDRYGVSSDFMEAMIFAWLAFKRINHEEVDLCCVTGAKKNSILGGVYG